MATFSKNIIEVGVAMVLKDQFSKGAENISSSFAKLQNEAGIWSRGLNDSLGESVSLGTNILKGFGQAYQYAAGVSEQVFLASKISGATAAEQAELMQVAKEVNERVPLTAKDIASGERFLAMAGNSAKAIKDMIGPASELASIAGMGVGEKGGVADLMTNVMATFNMSSDRAREAADKITAAAFSSNMSVLDLAEAFEYSGAEFRNAGIDMGDAAAAIGVLGDQGIQASSAGTALANMLRYLTLSVTQQKRTGVNALASLGLDPKQFLDAQGNLVGIDKQVQILGDALRGISGTQRSKALFNIFGVRGTRAGSALLYDYWNGHNKLLTLMDKIRNSQGILADLTEEWLKTPAGIIGQLKSNLENLVVTVGEGVAPVFNLVVQAANGIVKAVNWIADTSVGKWLLSATAISVAIGVVVNSYRLISNLLRVINTLGEVAKANDTQRNVKADIYNSKLAVSVAHWRTLIALQARSLALQSGMGFFNKSTGKFVFRGGKGKFQSEEDWIMNSGGGVLINNGTQTKSSSSGGSPTPSPKKTPLLGGMKGLAKVGSGLLGVLGGPWGIGISLGITAISTLLPSLIDSIEGNTDSNKKPQRTEDEEYAASREGRLARAMKEAIVEVNKDKKDPTIHLVIDGNSVGNYKDGDEFVYSILGLQP